MALVLDKNLRRYATDRQWELLEAWEQDGSCRKAALSLGLDESTIRKTLGQVRRRAARKGYAPDFDLVHPVAPGMSSRGTSIKYDGRGNVVEYWNKSRQEGRDPIDVVRLSDPKTVVKVSTLYDQEGYVTAQWVAEKPADLARKRAWETFAEELAKTVQPREPIPRREDVAYLSDLCAAYPIGDHHLGMLAWAQESSSGESYDLKIGERLLNHATDYLCLAVPHCAMALIAVLGDFFHYDSLVPKTPASGNVLDADSRPQKMIRVAVDSLCYTIDRALQVHHHVHVIIEIGNHDPYSAAFTMETLARLYRDEPRLTIDTSPRHYHYFRFGKVLIGTHHGHGPKLPELPLIMATDVPDLWGQTVHRYIWVGHVHHAQKLGVKDYQGATVETFQVLPPNDAWHSQKGYRSKQSMKAIVLHPEYGEVARHTVNPQMLAKKVSPKALAA